MPQAALQIPIDHPCFTGHFPGRPIVPGVVQLDAAQSIVEAAQSTVEADSALRVRGIAVAKFHTPACPGDELMLDYAFDKGAVRFEIRCGERKIADGKFVFDNEPLPA